MSFHCLLTSLVSDDKFLWITHKRTYVFTPPHVMRRSSLAAFKPSGSAVSLCGSLSHVVIPLGVAELLGSVKFSIKLGKLSPIIPSNNFSSPFSFEYSFYRYFGVFSVFWSSAHLLVFPCPFFSLKSFCWSSFSSTDSFFSVQNLLLNPDGEFLISVTVFSTPNISIRHLFYNFCLLENLCWLHFSLVF